MNLDSYDADGRAPLDELYARYDDLTVRFGFEKVSIYTFNRDVATEPEAMTVNCYRTPRPGLALWVLAGIHGEEPAGPVAIAQNIVPLGQLGQEIPLVILPLLNPKGYWRNWRYFDARGDERLGHSVSDAEHYLLSTAYPNRARTAFPSSDVAGTVTQFVLDTAKSYPPLLVLDHHEDDELPGCYIYSQGAMGAQDAVALEVLRILAASRLPRVTSGLTSFGEIIQDGMVVGENGRPVQDGSVDELLASDGIIVAGEPVSKPAARTTLVIETPVVNVPLQIRTEAHAAILRQLRWLWRLANQQPRQS
jgi:hypothetical protein